MNISGYVIDKQIGKGGMAMVYRATQESLGRPVALKVMNPLFSDTPEFSERFLDEGRLLAAVHHSNIITIHDIGISDAFHFISMEYVEGGDLGDKIKAGISPSQATAYVETLAECLAVAHDLHIVHRDIKPANILFRKDGTLLLTDFGIAKQLTTDKGLTATGAMVGSPHYLSPEQAQGKPVDGRSDLYSLGVVYYEMLTGERPFTGNSDVDIAIKHVTEPVPKLADAFAACSGIIDRMMRKDPDERFSSCRSLLVALRELRETGGWSGEIADIRLPAPPDSEAIAADVAAAAVGRSEGDVSPHEVGQTAAGTAHAGDTLVLDDTAVHDGDTIVQEGPPLAPVVQGDALPDGDAGGDATLVDIAPARAEVGGASRKRRTLALGVGVLVLVSVAVGTLFTDRTATVSEATVPASDAGVRTDSDGAALAMQEKEEKDRRAREFLIESLLRDAETAIADFRLTTPEATSAYTYYQKILEIEPEHPEAIKGIDDVADAYYRLAKSAEKDWAYDKALRFTNSGLAISADHEPLQALMQSLKAEDGTTGRKLKSTFKGVKGWFN